jgi:hypothetical protein
LPDEVASGSRPAPAAGPERKIATLLATVRWLEVTATDDALELFDVFMTGELIGRAAARTRRG